MSGVIALRHEERVVTACCGAHLPSGCCDEKCVACCPECVTCPEVHLRALERRAADAAEAREQQMLRRVMRNWAETLAVRVYVDTVVGALAGHTQTAVAVTDLFQPEGLEAASAALAELDLPHFEGSLT